MAHARRRQAAHALDVSEDVSVAVPDDLADLGVVAGGIRLHLGPQPIPVGEELLVGGAHGFQCGFAAPALGRPLERLERLAETAGHGRLVEVLLRPEQAKDVRLGDAGPLGDLLGRGCVEPAFGELDHGGLEDLFPALVGTLAFVGGDHAAMLVVTYKLVKRLGDPVEIRLVEP